MDFATSDTEQTADAAAGVDTPASTDADTDPAGAVVPADAPAATSPNASQRSIASTKIVIAGGFGVGKTTLVGTVSEIAPLRTEALVTNVSEGIDNIDNVPSKNTTTVAMDFGRISLSSDLVLYLFGTPGQRRFWFMWDDLSRGAIGAIVLIDTRSIQDSFSAVDYFEARRLPFVVAINEFDGAPQYETEDLREALAISPGVPIITIDARERESAKRALITVTSYALERVNAASA